MQFETDFFKGEVRQGFYIRPVMKRCWAAELEVYEEIVRICSKYGIRFFAMFGTLLGAVRDQGFIPWDDDMDLGMFREDYENFIKCADTELPEGWYLQNRRDSKDQDRSFICVRNSPWALHTDEDYLSRFHGCPYGVGVDVFPIDSVPENDDDADVMRVLIGAALDIGQNVPKETLLTECDTEIKREVYDLCSACGLDFDPDKPISPQAFTLADKLSAMYMGVNTKNVTVMSIYHSWAEYYHPRSAFDEVVMLPFENTTVPVMGMYDGVLKTMYGDDYMIPRQGTSSHNYPFFKNYEVILRKNFSDAGVDFPEEFK